MNETCYQTPSDRLDHAYGPNVHILSDPWALTLLAKLSSPDVDGRQFHDILVTCYRRMSHAIAQELLTAPASVPTRMAEFVEGAAVEGEFIAPEQPLVLVDVARAGMVPAHVLQLEYLQLLASSAVRVDHIYMQRVAGEDGKVSHVETAGSKIGGPVGGSTVIIPDPMGATGSSVSYVLDWYRNRMDGQPRKLITAHLIVTPEYLKRVTQQFPDVVVYALRVDRGLSSPDVLKARPGERWDEEVGLNDHDYIVPGAGGLGELINNAFV